MSQNLIVQFKDKYASLSGIPHEAASDAGVADIVLDILTAAQASHAALGDLPEAVGAQIEARCVSAGIGVIRPPFDGQSLPGAIDAVQVGISWAYYAVAESGSLIEFATNDALRLVSTLPRVHIGIVHADRILGTLKEAAAPLRAFYEAHPTNATATFISGPSRTADIEMRLTLGVHGPEVAHAIILNP